MLEEYPVLKNAPIKEAVIDFRVRLSSGFDVKQFGSLYEQLKDEYPETQVQRKSEIKVELRKERIVKPVSNQISGYRYVSSDKKKIVQAKMDGLTFSRLHPYIKWVEFHEEAQRLWQLYKDITSPESITRVALRYINNLNIPMPIIDFGDYLEAPPKVPEKLPQGVSSFLTRIVIHEPYIGANAIVTQALEKIVTDVAPVILDIDAFKLQPEGIEEDDAWEIIEKLRHFKNKIFFSSITESLKELYK